METTMPKKPKMTMRQYENSAQDKKADRAGAKRTGKSVEQYERSSDDEREDRKNIGKVNRKR